MMDIPTALIISGTTALVTGGVAWGSVKQALNGTRDRVKKIEADHGDHADRLARIETKIDILLEKR